MYPSFKTLNWTKYLKPIWNLKITNTTIEEEDGSKDVAFYRSSTTFKYLLDDWRDTLCWFQSELHLNSHIHDSFFVTPQRYIYRLIHITIISYCSTLLKFETNLLQAK